MTDSPADGSPSPSASHPLVAAGSGWRLPIGALVLVATLLGATGRWVDLNPTVQSDFFFSPGDPQLQESLALEARYPGGELVVVRAESPDVTSQDYLGRVEALGSTLASLPGVSQVYSVATESPSSPLWSRILVPEDGEATNLVLDLDLDLGSVSGAVLTDRIDGALTAHRDPDFELVASGVPLIVELIRRSLRHDLAVFSLAALVLFGLMATLVYRNARLVGGTLTACVGACAATLLLTHVLGIRVGLLTANIVTIVFVLTLSHTVFIAANWRRYGSEAPNPTAALAAALRKTIYPSIWCMLTTALGFGSLWLTSAQPLRELGTAGVVGTLIALLFAFTMLPAWLLTATGPAGSHQRRLRLPLLGRGPLLAVAMVTLAVGWGIPRIETDPSLVSYFDPGSEIREGLETIDRSGGSSPLLIAVRSAGGQTLDDRAAYQLMWTLQDSLEADPAVGVVLSPAPLLAHARQQPLAGFLPIPALIALMERPELGNMISRYMLPDRSEVLYSLRMVESGRDEPRDSVVSRLRGVTSRTGFEVTSVGGLYELQGRLGALIASSLRVGLGGLLVLFLGIAWVVSRNGGTAFAMLACLAGIPAMVLGLFGHLGIAVDIITSPAANVALAMGVDSSIHLVNRVRELGTAPARSGALWLQAREELTAPILTACGVICLGFGIFALSDFPPTRRFGTAVILGTMAAAAAAAVVLPSAMGRRAAGDSPKAPSGTPAASG